MDVEVTEVVPGELDVRVDDHRCRVLIPAGVGIPGLADEDLARALVAELLERGVVLPAVVDVASALRTDPGLLGAVEARALADDGESG